MVRSILSAMSDQDPGYGIDRSNIVARLHKRNWRKKAVARVRDGRSLYVWINKAGAVEGARHFTIYRVCLHPKVPGGYEADFEDLEAALAYANGEDGGMLAHESRVAKPDEWPEDAESEWTISLTSRAPGTKTRPPETPPASEESQEPDDDEDEDEENEALICTNCGAEIPENGSYGELACDDCGSTSCPFCGCSNNDYRCEHLLGYAGDDGECYAWCLESADIRQLTATVDEDISNEAIAARLGDMAGFLELYEDNEHGLSQPPAETDFMRKAVEVAGARIRVLEWRGMFGCGTSYFAEEPERATAALKDVVKRLASALAGLNND